MAKTIILISCVSKKLDRAAMACDLYTSALFKKALRYTKLLTPDEIFILSAKYGLLRLEQEIKPYNVTLNTMSEDEKKKWAGKVLEELEKEADLENDNFIFLAGNNYRKYLLPKLKHYEIPMKSKSIGKQLQFLDEQIKLLEGKQ